MFVTQSEIITVPASEATVLEIVDADGDTGRLVILDNRDGANTLTFTWQKSSDKSTWTDVGTTNDTLAPGQQEAFLFTEPESFMRLRAEGDLELAVAMLRWKAFNGTMPLVTL